VTVLKRTSYGTRVEGIDVVMTLGTREVRMDYDTAIKLAAFLGHSGRQAKRRAGDNSRSWIGCATLTDANLDELQAERSRDGTAVFKRH
jgi:hypothetical protein